MFKLRADLEDFAAPTELPTSINYCKYNLFIIPYMTPFSGNICTYNIVI